MKVLSVIIPVYNEENNLTLLYERLDQVIRRTGMRAEYVFVNDGSRDQSMSVLRDLAGKDDQVRYIDFSRNFGHQTAVSAGLDHCRGDAAVIIDADLQDPPELILQLLEKWHEGYEIAYARRRSRQGESILKKWTAGLFYRLLKKITSIPIPLDTGDYRIIDRKVIDVLKRMPEQQKFLRGQISWIGFRQTAVEYDREGRHSGKSGYSYGKMIRFAIDGITAFSNFPLRFATMMGFAVSGIAFLLILYALYQRLVTGNYVPGWASLMLAILFLGGVQLICLGIIGEYISRMDTNIRKRPLYIVRDSNIASIEERD